MNNIPSLYQISIEQQIINEKLFENDGELTPELEELMAINEGNLAVKSEDYLVAMADINAMMQRAKDEKKRIDAYIKRCERSVEAMKNRLATALQQFGYDKYEVGTHKLSFRQSDSVVIDDINALPREYVVYEPTANKNEIKQALKAGVAIEGARLEIKKNIQIK